MTFSYLFIFFTLPISVWFCFKNLSQWERIVIYRLGKLIGVKGPGNVFLIPWLDCFTKLDLRTQVICHPLKQVFWSIKLIAIACFKSCFYICMNFSFSQKIKLLLKLDVVFSTEFLIQFDILAMSGIQNSKDWKFLWMPLPLSG